MTMAIGQLQPLKPQFVLKSFSLVKNAAGNLVVRTRKYYNLPIVKSFRKNEKVSARKKCSSGGMAGNYYSSCSYRIDVNGKAAWVSEKYIGKAERCEEVSHPFGQGSMTMLECYDENGKIKSSKIISSTSTHKSPLELADNKREQENAKSEYTRGGHSLKFYGVLAIIVIGGILIFKK